MGRALTLGEQARRRTPPNPWVGAVVVRDGEVVGEGATRPPGGPHAEVEALRAAGDRARGATVYVTLEPCPHHGRTPPCVAALARRGRRAGGGRARRPRRARARRGHRRAARARHRRRRRGRSRARPRVRSRRTSRTARRAVPTSSRSPRRASTGGSRRATGRRDGSPAQTARADAHGLRADSQAVVVGAGTALADRPRLTVRDALPPVEQQPLRVVLDARGRVPADGAAVRHGSRAHARRHHRRRARRPR